MLFYRLVKHSIIPVWLEIFLLNLSCMCSLEWFYCCFFNKNNLFEKPPHIQSAGSSPHTCSSVSHLSHSLLPSDLCISRRLELAVEDFSNRMQAYQGTALLRTGQLPSLKESFFVWCGVPYRFCWFGYLFNDACSSEYVNWHVTFWHILILY